MSDHPVIDAKVREGAGRQAVKRLRREGFVPAILYAHDTEPTKLQVAERQLRTVIHSADSANFIIDLKIESGKGKQLALLQDIQMDPLSKALLHVDFQGVGANEKIHAHVTLHAVGTPKGTKGGGVLDQVLHTLEVVSIPDNLPEIINVDVANMEIGDTLHVSDLKLPEGVEAVLEDVTPVFSLTEPTVMPAEDEMVTAVGEPEVIGEKPADSEDAEASKPEA